MPPTRRGAALLAAALAAGPAGIGRAAPTPAQPPPPPSPPSTTTAAARPMTFEEVMDEGRDLGSVRVSPDGRRVLVAVQRNDRPTGGAPWKLNGTEASVWRLDGGPPQPIGGWGRAFLPALCAPWSPDARFVAGLVLRAGQRRLAAFDLTSRRLRVFGPPPLTMCPTWVGPRLVYPAPAPGGADGASAAPAARRLLARWRRAWTGPAPQVTVQSSNADFPGPTHPEGELVAADPASGRSAVIARGDFHSLTPAPDGRRFAAVRFGARDPRAISRQTGRIGELQLYALGAGPARRLWTLAGLDTDYAGLAWSPDGRRLLAGGRLIAEDALGLLDVDAARGVAHRIALPPGVRLGSNRRGAFSALRPIGWIGPRPAFIAAVERPRAAPGDGRSDYGEAGSGGFGLFVDTAQGVQTLTGFARQSVTTFAATGDGRALAVADGALWALRADTPPQRLSPPDLEVSALAEAHPSYGLPPIPALAADRVAVKARDASDGARVAVLDLAGGAVRLARPAAEVAALSPDLRTLVVRRAKGWSTTLALEGERRRNLTRLNGAWRDRPTGVVTPFDYTLNGRRLRSWIVLPPGHRDGPLPAILWVYGGDAYDLAPPAEARPGHAPTPLFAGQLWAARGYAVIYPSLPLASGADSDVPATLAAEAAAAVDAAAAHGWVDPRRVGLIGHSFGGYSVAAILSRTDRFRAGVALSGTYDFIASWGARQPLETLDDEDGHDFAEETRGFVEQGQIGLGAPPYAALAAYARASPLFAAPQIHAPLLLMAGDLDQGATSLSQAERMYAALSRSGSPAAMVRYWGQDHVQDEPWAVRDQWRRATAWFDLHLRQAQGLPTDTPRPPPNPSTR